MSARFLTARRRRDPQLFRPAAGLLAAAGRPRVKAPLGLVEGGNPPAPIPFSGPQAQRENVSFRLSPAEEDQLRSLLAALGTRAQGAPRHGEAARRWRTTLLCGTVLLVGVLVPHFRSSPGAGALRPMPSIALPVPPATPELIAAREGEGVPVATAPAVPSDRVEAPAAEALVTPAPAPILADPPLPGPAAPPTIGSAAVVPPPSPSASPELVASREGEGEPGPAVPAANTAAVPATPAAAPGRSFFVQFGAFHTETNAARDCAGFAALTPVAVVAGTGGSHWFFCRSADAVDLTMAQVIAAEAAMKLHEKAILIRAAAQ